MPIGQSLEQLIYHDFDKTPHMTLGGLTRMGKTVFLKNVMTSLLLHKQIIRTCLLLI